MDSDYFLLYGNISGQDIVRARDILGTQDVYEVRMKETDPQLSDVLGVIVYVRYHFIDLPLISTLTELLEPESSKIKEVIKYFKLSGKSSNFISINLVFTYDRKIFTVLLVSEDWKYDLMLSVFEKQVLEIAEKASQDDCFKIMLTETDDLDISSCKHLQDLYSIVKETI